MRSIATIFKSLAVAGALVLSSGTAAHAAPGCSGLYPPPSGCRYVSVGGGTLSISGFDIASSASITVTAAINGTVVGSCSATGSGFAVCSYSGPPITVAPGDWISCWATGSTVGMYFCND